MKNFRISSIIFVLNITLLAALFAVPTIAQDAQRDMTPREHIIHDLGLGGLPIVKPADLPVTSATKIIAKGGEADTDKPASASDYIKNLFKQDVPKIPDTKSLVTEKTVTKIASEPRLKILKTTIPKTTPKTTSPKIAPFYLSAKDYLNLRGGKANLQTILSYKVESGSVAGTNLSRNTAVPQNIKLLIGADFVAMEAAKKTTIYDFKLNRILVVKPEYGMDGKTTGRHLFENNSLYAKAYRDIAAVRGATKNGRLQKLDMGGGIFLDAYWVESAMSWAAGKLDAGLAVEKTGKSLKIERDGEVVFRAEFSDDAYLDNGSKNALLAFAHHKWPLHPLVLQALYAYDAPPVQFEMLSYGPTAPKGQKQVWILTERTDVEKGFPLPANAIGIAQIKQVSPLAFLIDEAVNNRALGGIQSVVDMTRDFTQKLNAEEYWQAWLIGQKYIAYSGGCKNPADMSICKKVTMIEENHKNTFPKRIQNYLTAVNSAGRPGLKAEAIKSITPYLGKKETPAFIVRTAAMARAQMKSAQAISAGFSDMNAETLLQTALAKDPYDPNTYVGLAQVLAAKGAFEQSWDLYDALRAGIPTADSIDLKINRLEKNLQKTAPGYFLGE